MTSVRPYLIRALVDWIVDNALTPYITIDCRAPGVEAPPGYVNDDVLVLNISAAATRNLVIADQTISVDCRFRGRPVQVKAPIGAVVAVYARENGQGMAFEVEAPTPDGGAAADDKAAPAGHPRGGPELTVVK